jgi:AcrR family transcriptional regulator
MSEGLRERKKRLTRQRISDTATALFLERGFSEVTVAEVAAACDVSEKTVFNYFPTKESLLLDREEAWAAAIHQALAPGGPAISPVEATLAVIIEQLNLLYGEQSDGALDLTAVRGVSELIHRTPSLRAANAEMTERIISVAARALAARAGLDPDDPEPQIAAAALVGLWRVQFRSMRRYSDGFLPQAEVREKVVADVRRAARLIDTGLRAFGHAAPGV